MQRRALFLLGTAPVSHSAFATCVIFAQSDGRTPSDATLRVRVILTNKTLSFPLPRTGASTMSPCPLHGFGSIVPNAINLMEDAPRTLMSSLTLAS